MDRPFRGFRGGSRGNRGGQSRGNRGNRGNRVDRGRSHKRDINDINDYFNMNNDNNNDNNNNNDYYYNKNNNNNYYNNNNKNHEKHKNKAKKDINDINDYFNMNNNSNNDNYYNQKKEKHKTKKKKDINNIDDYFNIQNDNNKNYSGQKYQKKENDEDYNIFSNNNEDNIYKGVKHQKRNQTKNYTKINEDENMEFNKSNKEIKSVKKVFISYTQLKEILDKDDNEIMQFFMKFKDLPEVFKNTKFTKDMIDLMTELLSKMSMINSGPATTALNQIFINTNFLDIIRERLREEDYMAENYLKFLYNVAQLGNKLIDKFTDDVKRIRFSELSEYSEFLKSLIKQDKIKNYLELALKIIDIMDEFKEKENHKKMNKLQEKEKEKEKIKINNKENIFDINSIPIDYNNRNIYISSEDFNEKLDIIIAPHIKSGSYISYERYINTMFYLEYEDCYRDLRKTINIFQGMNKSINNMDKKELQKLSKIYSDLYFYLKGEIIYIDINRDGVILTMDFIAPSPRKIKFTKRMITGSLIILTDNNYENYLLTTVFYNPYVDKKINEGNIRQRQLKIPKYPYYRVQLSLVNINPESFLFLVQNRKNLQIFESKAYFESYIHIMKRLKEINIPDLPFKNELIDANFNRLIMRHVNENYNYHYNDIYLNPYKKYYPQQFRNLLDISQLNAIHKCLLYKIALIQGPPGTGKTHVGTILANIILQNLKPQAQILVVCFTNHALDSFIEDILKYTDDVVRIGGRCKNEKVKEKALVNKAKFSNKTYRGIVNQLEQLGENMKAITSLIDVRRKVDVFMVKRFFPNLFNKIIDDFYVIANSSIPQNWRINLKRSLSNDLQINKEIYIFWNLIGFKNNLRELILNILDNIDINEKARDFLYIKIYDNFGGYDKDNLQLLKYLNNYNEPINNIINNENNPQEEEEEEEDDEEELAQNMDRLDIDYYLEELYKKDNNQNNIINEEEDQLFDENDEDLRKLVPLNEEKFNYLLTCGINFFKLGPKIIKLIIDYMKNKLLLNNLNNNNDEFITFKNLLTKKNEVSLMSDAEAIKSFKIVAMTTTGCAKYSTILEQNNFETIIIEEAAEVLESHVLSLLTKNTKQLILIGDHKQLKPKPYNFELETKYNFNVSMFERLINNDIPFATLKYQRRMKPKFADFVRIIYGDEVYMDHDDVKGKPDIKGMEKDMYIVTHNNLESENEGLKSKQNDYEAIYLTKLCNYLLKQGYSNNQITILTFYVGQVLLIKKHMKKFGLNDVRVSSVDNYQGEECDIILLSLVRSNKKNEIGFLRNFNRVCVAFSRAKIGLYIIGNINFIAQSEALFKEKNKNNIEKKIDPKMMDVWEKIKKKAIEMDLIGDKLTLVCQNHKNKTIISNHKDFENCPEGGCQEICKKRMKCGHVCERTCHIYDCNENKCLKPCRKINKNCKLLIHECKKRCYEDCGRCEEKVDKKLPCGHIKKKCKCYEDENLIKCIEKCDKKLKCGHKCTLNCCDDCKTCKCTEKIKVKIVSCAHINEIECNLMSNVLNIICQEKCNKVLPCGHNCQGTCGLCLQGSLHAKCGVKCGRNLPCGHICSQKCSSECLCDKKCPNKCDHGYCALNCCDICVDCEEDCTIGCIHEKCEKKCGQLCERKPCEKRCEKKMKCGHQCYGLCGERCPEVCRICDPNLNCFKEDFFYLSELDEDALLYKTKCGHLFEVHGLDQYLKSQKSIQMYTCPQCKSLLIMEPRYQNLIKGVFTDIQKIKKVSLDRNMGNGDKTFLLKSQEIVNRILYQQYAIQKINIFDILPQNNLLSNNMFYFKYDGYDLKRKIPVIYNLCKNVFNEKDLNSKRNTTYNLLTLAEKFMGIEYYVYKIKNECNENKEYQFLINFNIVKTYFKDFQGQFNNYFFNDLRTKIDNMLYYSILKLSGYKPNKNNGVFNNLFGVNSRFNRINNNDSKLKTDEEIKKGNFSIELDLKDLYKKNKINIETLNLLRTLGTTWYKCPNGHLYVVGECGGPMQQGICPECGADIGGRAHIPANRNEAVDLNMAMNNLNLNDNNRIRNPLLNQDQEAQNNMNRQHFNNQEHHMDEDIEQLLREHPEMNNYFNNQ